MRHLSLVLLAAIVLFGGMHPAAAREITLEVGETFRDNDLTVRCVETTEPQLIVLTDCQFWNDFEQICLYERLTYHYGRLQCVEECRYWDSFDNVCYFADRCDLLPAQRAFLRTSCDIFDELENVCRRTRQELLR